MNNRKLVSASEAADYLGLAEQTLTNWRYRGRGPRFYRVGQLVKYDRADLDAWLDENASDSQPATA